MNKIKFSAVEQSCTDWGSQFILQWSAGKIAWHIRAFNCKIGGKRATFHDMFPACRFWRWGLLYSLETLAGINATVIWKTKACQWHLEKRDFSRGIVLAFIVTGILVIFWYVLNTHANKQTNKHSVCIYSCSSIYFQHFCFAPEKSNSEWIGFFRSLKFCSLLSAVLVSVWCWLCVLHQLAVCGHDQVLWYLCMYYVCMYTVCVRACVRVC